MSKIGGAAMGRYSHRNKGPAARVEGGVEFFIGRLAGSRTLTPDRQSRREPQNRLDDMKSTGFLISTLGIALLAGGGSAVAQRYSYGPQAREGFRRGYEQRARQIYRGYR